MTEVVQHVLGAAKPTTKTFKTGKPVAYTADVAVYVDGTLFKVGETFVTDKPKSAVWNPVSAREKAAADAGASIHGDVDLEALEVPALQALAATKGINLGDVKGKKDIIAVLKAADEPTL